MSLRVAPFALLLAWGHAGPLARALAAPPITCRETAGQIVNASVASGVYGALVPVSIYLPPCYNRASEKLPVIYLLHGGNADETQWPDLRVQPEADALIASGTPPFVVVMPGGVYRDGVDYTAFVLDDLLPSIENQFKVKATGSSRAIGGISLGGYWALKIAFQHPDLFAAVGGHSPVVSRGQADDPLTLARTVQGADHLRITLDVGKDDSLRSDTEQLAVALRARGLTVTLAVNAGGHNRPYWRSHTDEYLRFYLAALVPVPCHRCHCSRH